MIALSVRLSGTGGRSMPARTNSASPAHGDFAPPAHGDFVPPSHGDFAARVFVIFDAQPQFK
jgi:hypothetical protein